MATDPLVCQWTTCDKPARPNGYLCDQHLALVQGERLPLRELIVRLAGALTVGAAGNALYEATKEFMGMEAGCFNEEGRKNVRDALRAGDVEGAMRIINRPTYRNPHNEAHLAALIVRTLSGSGSNA